MPGVDFWVNAAGAKTGADQWTAALLRIDRSAQETALHLERMAARSQNATQTIGQGAKSGILDFARMATGVSGVGIAVLKTVGHYRQLLNEADRLGDLAHRFDLPVETLSIFAEEAKLVGKNVDDVARSLQALAIARAAAIKDPTGSSAQNFNDLAQAAGTVIDVTAPLPSVIDQVSEAFLKSQDAARDNVIAQKLLGRTGGDLVAVYEEIARKGGVLSQTAKFTDDNAEAADRAEKSWKRLGDAWDHLLLKAAPIADMLAEALNPPGLSPTGELTAAQQSAQQARQFTGQNLPEFIALEDAATEASAAKLKAFIDLRNATTAGEGTAQLEKLRAALKEAAKAYDDAAAAIRNFRAASVAGLPTAGTPAALPLDQQNFIDKIKDQATALGLAGFAAEAFKIKQQALDAGFKDSSDSALKFSDSLAGAIRTLQEATAINAAKNAIDGLEAAIQKVGATDAEQRLIDFNKALKDIGSSGTGIDLLRQKFEAFNLTLQKTADTKIFTDQTKALKENNSLILQGIDAREQEAAVLELVRATQGRATDAQKEAVRVLVQQQQELTRLQQAADAMATALTGAFESAIFDATSLKDVVRSLALELSRIGFRTFFSGPATNFLSGFFSSLFQGAVAHGGAFSGGRALPFAAGGIVNRPTLFPMAGGAGLMGEAGPEAIMPLRQGPGGLSVRSDALGGLLPIGRIGGDLGVRLFARGGLVPSGTSQGGGGVGTVVNLVQNVTIRGGADGAGARRSARQMARDFRSEMERSGG